MNPDLPLLKIENLSTWLDTQDAVVRAIEGLSLEIGRGETYALLGESGCGKSMTALSVMRLLPDAGQVVSGTVELAGEDLLRRPEIEMRDIRGRRVAMIFQEPMLSLNPVMTVGAQIAETLERHTGLAGAALDARVVELLNAVGIPDPDRRRAEYPFQLSGGMKQRVMIAMALACDPELLIADEPTTALDVTIQAQILDLLRELQKKTGMSVLLITHDLAVVAEMAQRVAVMYAGEIVETASREQFFSTPAHPYSRKLFDSMPGNHRRGGTLAVIRGSVPALTREFVGCRFAERCDHAWDLCRSTAPPWYELGGGQGARCHLFAPGEKIEKKGERSAAEPEGREASGVRREAVLPLTPHPSPLTDPLLRVEDLKVHFPIRSGVLQRVSGHVKAVDGVSLTIAAGRTLGLVGESGCGKTTVGKGILRLTEPTGGRVLFAGEDLAHLTHAELRAKRNQVQIIFQDPYASLNPRMRVAEIIEEGMSALGVGAGAADRAKRIDALLNEVGLAPEMKHRYPHEFSGGQRQRIAIARALSVEPRLIICDEPTSALDVSVQAQILNLLKSLQDKMGLAYLFITHNISVVEFLAHEVAVMYLGRIVETGTVDEVLKSPQHPYTRALLSAVPVIDPAQRREIIRLKGDMPSPVNPPAGCHFHPRCPQAMSECKERYPQRTQLTATHAVHCHLYKQRN
ncbi:MAG: ABC transporter ATP-binding protein [Betaproteobacteria bacterium RIFCSPLOWO2_12_FULL_65_14]|nr:MAG: ABC transporter ATP-binding protein [Betaproteobacteria bacterium RIFCSPLOWO2_12_FULL_65_14]